MSAVCLMWKTILLLNHCRTFPLKCKLTLFHIPSFTNVAKNQNVLYFPLPPTLPVFTVKAVNTFHSFLDFLNFIFIFKIFYVCAYIFIYPLVVFLFIHRKISQVPVETWVEIKQRLRQSWSLWQMQQLTGDVVLCILVMNSLVVLQCS